MIKVGIVGVGVIARAMVEGLLQTDRGDLRICLSPRNKAVVQDLCTRYSQAVSAASSNQDVVDKSETVILSVRPDDAQSVLAALAFRPNQTIVSVMAGLTREAIAAWIRPATNITVCIPLLAMARGAAITAIMPPGREVAALFRRAGPVLEVEQASALTALSAVTAVMAAQYKLWDVATQWLVRQEMPAHDAHAYVLSLVSGLVANANGGSHARFKDLESEVALPGSYNAGLRQHLQAHGVFAAVDSGLDAALARMTAFSKST